MALRMNNVGIVVEDLKLAIGVRCDLIEDIIGLDERRWKGEGVMVTPGPVSGSASPGSHGAVLGNLGLEELATASDRTGVDLVLLALVVVAGKHLSHLAQRVVVHI